ncbi:MAG: Asp-tRNA(Asn)/Glu-tRNA(Gln) amidotransferase subunit GatA [Lentisphaeria bacterium]|nr:Asp-tRNA(Asn)/Glu-tRNA(Gln) amidotransferase subunit GatA [Lentisphaeria bacterium]
MMNIAEAAAALANGSVSSVQLVEEVISAVTQRDGAIKAFLKLDAEKVRAMAAESDARRAAGKALSEYDGIPIGIKDCIVTKDETCACASRILENVVSPYDSTAVAKLKALGFIPTGRLNMVEFAMGSSCENIAFQKTANPWDISRVPGGYSGGSAAAVGGRLVPAALGSDTGGSIRQPASFCGIVGLKPTYGRVSRHALVAFASSLDQIGPMTTSVEDAAILLQAICGVDSFDSTSLPLEKEDFAGAVKEASVDEFKTLRVGLPEEYFSAEGMSAEVKEVIDNTVEQIKAAGAEIVPVKLPHTKYAVAVYYIIATAEASANLARFDGIRYGARKEAKDLVSSYFASRGAGFGEEVKRRILLGTYVLSSGYYDAYYLRAQKVRTLIRRDFEEAFKSCDILLTPVAPNVAFKFGEKSSNPLEMYLSDIFTIALNLAGNCGISVPAALGSESSMPVGIQLIAPAMQEAKLLKNARAFELLRGEFPAPQGC